MCHLLFCVCAVCIPLVLAVETGDGGALICLAHGCIPFAEKEPEEQEQLTASAACAHLSLAGLLCVWPASQGLCIVLDAVCMLFSSDLDPFALLG